MSLRNTKFVAAALMIAASAAVFATVTFDPATGTGFVGKGDVQTAFGWNNAAAQRNAGGVTFAAESRQTRAQECVLQDQSVQTFVGYRTGTQSVSAQIAYDARTHKQVDGFFLTGYIGGDPVYGDWSDWVGPNGETSGNTCGGAQGENVHPIGEPIVTSDPTGSGLFVIYGGTSVKIWP
jgi:hypothetical protein